MNDEPMKELLKRADARFPLSAKIIIGVVIVALIADTCGVAYYFHQKHEQAVILTKQQAADNKTLAEKLNVTQKEAAQINSARQNSPPVYVSYSVPATSAQKAAEVVKRDNDAGVGPVGSIKADRTLIVPKQEEYKVEVSKITLDKRWEIGIGAIGTYNGINPAATIQYNSGHMAYQVIGGPGVAGAFVKVRF
jgi:hypothetical protein